MLPSEETYIKLKYKLITREELSCAPLQQLTSRYPQATYNDIFDICYDYRWRDSGHEYTFDTFNKLLIEILYKYEKD